MKFTYPMPSSWAERPIRIALVGAGGTGSDLAVRLAKLHRQLVALGSPGLDVTIFDPDICSENNVGRQHFSPSAVGLNKAVILVHSLNLAYALNWKASPQTFSPERAAIGYLSFDLLIGAVDKASFRAELGEAFKHHRTNALWCDCGNGASNGQMVLGHLGVPTGPRLPSVYDLYPSLAQMQQTDAQTSSCSAEEAMRRQSWPVNQTASLLAAELLWNLIRNGRIDYHGASFTLNPMTVTPMWIDTQAWSFFGYDSGTQWADLAVAA